MKKFGTYEIQCRDALDALPDLRRCSVHAVVTDPPFGLVEFTSEQLAKLWSGKGGIWRLPRNYDGYLRQPAPRFTVLTKEQHDEIRTFFAPNRSKSVQSLGSGWARLSCLAHYGLTSGRSIFC